MIGGFFSITALAILGFLESIGADHLRIKTLFYYYNLLLSVGLLFSLSVSTTTSIYLSIFLSVWMNRWSNVSIHPFVHPSTHLSTLWRRNVKNTHLQSLIIRFYLKLLLFDHVIGWAKQMSLKMSSHFIFIM